MRLPNRLFPALLSLGACLCLTPGIAMAQRGGGGHGGGGGGMRGGGGMGGGMRGGFGGGGFRGGGFGGFRGGGFRGGFIGGNRFRGGFINRGIGFGRGFGGGWGWGWGGGWWPGWDSGWGSGWDSGYAYPVDYGYPAYGGASAYPAYAGYPQQAPQQPGQNITVIYPPQQAVGPIIREYDEYGQEMRSPGPGPAASLNAPAAPAAAAPVYLIAFKDHEIWAVSAYWLTGTTLHFVTLEHQERQAAMDTVDRDLSNRLNRERHVNFSLDR